MKTKKKLIYIFVLTITACFTITALAEEKGVDIDQDFTRLRNEFGLPLQQYKFKGDIKNYEAKFYIDPSINLNLIVPTLADKTSQDSATDLAKKTQNPIADMVSLPFQYNTYFETGPKGKTQSTLLVQPVIPFSLNDDWNFIARPIIPLMDQAPLTDAQNRNHGLGNIQFQGFFSPKEKVGDWIIGFGPYMEFPTNSGPDGRFGSDNWSAGPAVVALKMEGPWVYGGLLTHLWSYYGNDPEVNLTSFQPFVNYNLEDGWYLSAAPTITANWSEGDSDNQWTVPIGGGIGKVFHIGKQPVNASIRAYHNLQSPRSGADWQLQFQIQFLF